MIEVICEYLAFSDGLQKLRLVWMQGVEHLESILLPQLLRNPEKLRQSFLRDSKGVYIVC
jgi:hypothetical protein